MSSLFKDRKKTGEHQKRARETIHSGNLLCFLKSVKTNRLAKVSQIDLAVTHSTIKQATRTIRKGPIAAAPAVPPKADTRAESNEHETASDANNTQPVLPKLESKANSTPCG
tara:strand:+ start:980 stop:1315 length:336 start_codon:yes stop_codon:yes gene_type:complete